MSAVDPWTVAIVAFLMIVLLGLLYLRRRNQTTVSFRLLGRVVVSSGRPKICPHLGLSDDPFVHKERPDADHRCYLWMQRDRIDMSHQKGFCLSVAHQHCPWLAIGSGSGGTTRRRIGAAGEIPGALAAALSLRGGRLGARIAPYAAVAATAMVLAAHRLSEFLRRRSAGAARASKHGVLSAAAWTRPRAGAVGMASVSAARQLSRRTHAAIQAQLAARKDSGMSTASEQSETVDSAPVPGPAKPPKPSAVVGADVARLIQDGKLAGMSGNRKMAYASFSLATELDPGNDEAWLWRAAMTDKREEKQRCLEQALALNPTNARARAGAKQLAQAPGEETPKVGTARPMVVVEAPLPAPRRGRRGKVQSPGDIDALEQGLAALERGEEDEAYRLFKRATELNSESEKAWFWRAKTATSLAELISCLEHALAINPANEKVRSNLAWATERMEREQRRRHYAQPFAQDPAPIAGGSQAAPAMFPLRRPAFTVVPGRTQQKGMLRLIAGVTSLLLAFYWLWGALVPTLGLPRVPGASTLALLLPAFAFSGAAWYESFELLPGYNLLTVAPYAVGFLFLFVARGLIARERWALLWGVLLAAATVVVGLGFVSNPTAVIVAAMLCMSLAGGILVSKREFVP